jgi:hypothetical protein
LTVTKLLKPFSSARHPRVVGIPIASGIGLDFRDRYLDQP